MASFEPDAQPTRRFPAGRTRARSRRRAAARPPVRPAAAGRQRLVRRPAAAPPRPPPVRTPQNGPGRPGPPAAAAGPVPAGPAPAARPAGPTGSPVAATAPGGGPAVGCSAASSSVLAALVVVQALVVLSLRWVDPPTTAFMSANPDGAIQQSVPVEHVSRNFLAAVIAHEDAALPYRAGAFEWDELWGRAQAICAGEEDPSGSTIPQQVAKNLFLNQEMSAWRKAVEARHCRWRWPRSSTTAGCSSSTSTTRSSARRSTASARRAGTTSTPRRASCRRPRPCSWSGLLPSPGHVQRAPGGGMDFEVDDGLGWLSRSHVLNAAEPGAGPPRAARLPARRGRRRRGAGRRTRSRRTTTARPAPDEVAELIEAEGTA